jgi:hypothetical protein
LDGEVVHRSWEAAADLVDQGGGSSENRASVAGECEVMGQ